MTDLQIGFHEVKDEADVRLVSEGVKKLQIETIIDFIQIVGTTKVFVAQNKKRNKKQHQWPTPMMFG